MKKYIYPVIDVTEFDSTDIITTSGGGVIGENGNNDEHELPTVPVSGWVTLD